MKIQAVIVSEPDESGFRVHTEELDNNPDTVFQSYEDALSHILERGWQLKRDTPAQSLHVETRFMKP